MMTGGVGVAPAGLAIDSHAASRARSKTIRTLTGSPPLDGDLFARISVPQPAPTGLPNPAETGGWQLQVARHPPGAYRGLGIMAHPAIFLNSNWLALMAATRAGAERSFRMPLIWLSLLPPNKGQWRIPSPYRSPCCLTPGQAVTATLSLSAADRDSGKRRASPVTRSTSIQLRIHSTIPTPSVGRWMATTQSPPVSPNPSR
jgi:hypothetical protein